MLPFTIMILFNECVLLFVSEIDFSSTLDVHSNCWEN